MKISVENLLSHGILIARILRNCLWFSCAGISISIWFVVMYLAANILVWVNVFLCFDILFLFRFVVVLDLFYRVFWHFETCGFMTFWKSKLLRVVSFSNYHSRIYQISKSCWNRVSGSSFHFIVSLWIWNL